MFFWHAFNLRYFEPHSCTFLHIHNYSCLSSYASCQIWYFIIMHNIVVPGVWIMTFHISIFWCKGTNQNINECMIDEMQTVLFWGKFENDLFPKCSKNIVLPNFRINRRIWQSCTKNFFRLIYSQNVFGLAETPLQYERKSLTHIILVLSNTKPFQEK